MRPKSQTRTQTRTRLRRTGYGLLLGLVGSAALLATWDLAASDGAPEQVLKGTEVGEISFRSTSPYDFINQIDGTAPAVEVTGDLTFPVGVATDTKVPAMILLHGSSGRSDWLERYAGPLREEGIATFVLDSFTPRGVARTSHDQARLVTEQMMMADAFAALRLLSTDPRIDPTRIAVMGFSKGGSVALYAAFEGIATWYAEAGPRFAAHIAFYPFCGVTVEDQQLTKAPVLMLLGGADDYTLAEDCLALQRSTPQDTRGQIRSKVYPKAHHAFTNLGPVQEHAFFNPANCAFHVGKDGVLSDAKTGKPASTLNQRVTALSGCGRVGVTMGGNDHARTQSLEDAMIFIRRVLE